MAEGKRFELSVELPPHNLSKVAPSTTRTPFQWWWGKDSNLGRRKPADLQSALVDRLSIPPSLYTSPDSKLFGKDGARGGTRTRKDLSTCTSSMRVCQFHHPSRRENDVYYITDRTALQ